MITQVANPSSVPSAVADYAAQNAHISAFNNIVNNQPFILTNSGGTGLPAIKVGTYIQYGGNLYVVDTEDYAISGTPVNGNNYIRLSGSITLTAEWIQDISSYVWNEVYGYKESGSYFLLPYLVVKDGTSYDKYSYSPVYPSFTDQELKTTDSPTFAKLKLTTSTLGSQSIDAKSSWVVPVGIYQMALSDSSTYIEVNYGSGWVGSGSSYIGAVISDGSNVRINNTYATAITIYYRKFS
jgi:hypothetical protein